MSDLYPVHLPPSSLSRVHYLAKFSVPPPASAASNGGPELHRPRKVKEKPKTPGLDSKKRKKKSNESDPADGDADDSDDRLWRLSFEGRPFRGESQNRTDNPARPGLALADGRQLPYSVLQFHHGQFTLLPCDLLLFRPVEEDAKAISLEEAEKLMKMKVKRFERRHARLAMMEQRGAAEQLEGANRLHTTRVKSVEDGQGEAEAIFEVGGESIAQFSSRTAKLKRRKGKRERGIDFDENFDDDDEAAASEEREAEESEHAQESDADSQADKDNQHKKKMEKLIEKAEKQENPNAKKSKKKSQTEEENEESEEQEEEQEEQEPESDSGAEDFQEEDLSLSESEDETEGKNKTEEIKIEENQPSKKRMREQEQSSAAQANVNTSISTSTSTSTNAGAEKRARVEQRVVSEADVINEFGRSASMSIQELAKRLKSRGFAPEASAALIKKLCEKVGGEVRLKPEFTNK